MLTKFRGCYLLYAENSAFVEGTRKEPYNKDEIMAHCDMTKYDNQELDIPFFAKLSLLIVGIIILIIITTSIVYGFNALVLAAENLVWILIAIGLWVFALILLKVIGKQIWNSVYQMVMIERFKHSKSLLYTHLIQTFKIERGRITMVEDNKDYTRIYYKFIVGNDYVFREFITKSEEAQHLKNDDLVLVAAIRGYSILL